MTPKQALESAAQCWCSKKTSGIDLDINLCGEVAKRIHMEVMCERQRWVKYIMDISGALGRGVDWGDMSESKAAHICGFMEACKTIVEKMDEEIRKDLGDAKEEGSEEKGSVEEEA